MRRRLPIAILGLLLGTIQRGPAGAGPGAAPCEVQGTSGALPGEVHNFGTSLGIHGSVAVIATTGESLEVEGSAHVHRQTENGLALQTMFHSGVVECQNGFGTSMAMDGSVIAVGDPFEGAPECGSGAVYVYRMYDGLPMFETKLTASNGASFDRFGNSVSVWADTIFVGAWAHDTNGLQDAGAAYVFRRLDGVWTEEAILADPVPEQGDFFGTSVAFVNNVAIVGAHAADGPAINTGAAFVFRYEAGQWIFEEELKPHGAAGEDWFGWSLALDNAGDTVVIGAIQDLSQFGSAFIFEHEGSTWHEAAKLQARKTFGTVAFFGGSVDISEDGSTILVGAPHDSEAGYEAGAAHFFRRLGPTAWTEVDKFIKPGSSCLGASVALDGDVALIGDPCREPGGRVYVLSGVLGIDCNGNSQPDACDIFTGTSADLDGNGIPDECSIVGDMNGDGFVAIVDFLALLASWGSCPGPCPPSCSGDFDGNCEVAITDFLLLLGSWTSPLPLLTCPGSGDCCSPHGTAGCQDEACCEATCALDPFCCAVVWDMICSNESQSLCGCPLPAACGGPAGDCCAFGGLPGPGCSDAACCEAICDYVDPFCCQVQWDSTCQGWALQFCDCPPSECSPDAGTCCQANGGPGCNDLECCTLVCEQLDPFCCDVAWDCICANIAFNFCKVCSGPPSGG